jgi:class 3 adenylate cyclase/TolB-like protein/Tfp pilus assembly protein PilF
MLNQKENELVAIMFADIANYTALMQKSEFQAKALLDAFQKSLQSLVPKHYGEIVNSYGDGCLIKFYSAESALKAAMEIQSEFIQGKIKVPVRIGIHLGDVFIKDGNIYGNSVNIASRIESFAIPGSVLFSEEVFAQISNKESFSYKNLGGVNFKNDNKTRTLYALVGENLVIPQKGDLKGKGKVNSNSRYKYIAFAITFLTIAFFIFLKLKTPNDISNLVEKSIAVLPLKNLTNKEENLDYFSDGLTAEIIDELAKINSFSIRSYTQSVFYKASDANIKIIAEELGVNYIIAGNFRLLPDRQIKLSIELFNPFSNKRVWYDNFVDSIDHSQTFQVKVAKQIAKSLNVELSPTEELNLDKLNTEDGEAFRLFLKAKSEMDKFSLSGFEKARTYLDKAIEIDSNYAQAYTLKAWNILLMSDPQIIPSSSIHSNDLDLIDDLLEKSMNLRPNFSDNYLVKSNQSLYAKNKIQDAIDDVEHAIELKSWPRIPTNYCTCTMISAMISGHKFERAEELIKVAEKVDPENILQFWDKGTIELSQGNLIAAEKHFKTAYNDVPIEHFRAYLSIALYHLKKYDELIQLYSASEAPDEPLTLLSLAYLSNANFQLGFKDKSDQLLKRIQQREEQGNINIYLAIVYAGREETKTAMHYFEKAYLSNEYGIAAMSSIYPIFHSLSTFPKYQKIRKEMQFQ